MTLVLSVLTAVLVRAAPVHAAPAGAGPVLVVDGRGFGHGVGMAQDGALAMGAAGSTTTEILGQFYPGTTMGQATGSVRVPVLEAPTGSAVLRFPSGGEIRSAIDGAQAPGFPMVVAAGESVTVRHDGGVHAAGGGGGSGVSSPSALFAVPAEGSTVALDGRSARYRGLMEVTTAGRGLRLVNRLDVEDYLRGMGEVRDARWPPASLGAQAVAARTYALRAMAAAGEICATQRCQVYLGQQVEYPAMDAAVTATKGQVLLYGGELAATVYSANGGGVSATPVEGFGPGGSDVPYLRSAPYPAGEPDEWQVRIDLADLAVRVGYPSVLRSVEVSAVGPSGRATAVELRGDAGVRTLAARTFARALSLRSTLWTLSLDGAGAAPEAPPAVPVGELPETDVLIAEAPPVDVPVADTPVAATGRSAALSAQDRILEQPAAGAVDPPRTASSEGASGRWWALYGAIFVVTASWRRLLSLWTVRR